MAIRVLSPLRGIRVRCQAVYLLLQALDLALVAVVLADELGQAGEQFGVAPPIIYKEGDEDYDDDQDGGGEGHGEDEGDVEVCFHCRFVCDFGGEGTKKAASR